MNIRQQIITGFGAIAALFALAGSFHVAHLMQARTHIHQITHTNIEELESSEAVFQHVQKAQSNLRLLAIETQQQTQDKRRATAMNIQSNLDHAMDALLALKAISQAQLGHGDPEGETMELHRIETLETRLRSFAALTSRAVELLEAGKVIKAVTMLEATIPPVALSIQASVSELESDAEAEIHASLDEAVACVQRSLWYSVALTLMAALVTIGMGGYISSRISSSVRQLHKATTRLGQGKLDTRVEIASNDEIGQIASDVNGMAEGLRNAIVSRDDLAKEVSERKKAAAMLVSQRTQAQSYLDIADVMLAALDTEGNITLINRKGRQIIGYQEHEMLGKNWFELCIVAEDREAIRQVFNQLMAGEHVSAEYYENRIVTRSGERKLIAFHNTPLRDRHDNITGVLFSGEDITGRRQAEEALRESEQETRLLLDSMEEAIYGLDLDGHCTFANAAFLRLLGYADASEVIGKNIHDMIHHTRPNGSPYPVGECRACMSFRTGQGTHVDDEIFWRKDGSGIPISYWSRPVRKNSTITGSVVTFLDISDRIKAREDLLESRGHLRASLEGTIAAICKAVEARDPYTAGHQLRVADLASGIASEMSLDANRIEGIRMGASIHDIGKIHLPAEILSKPTKLSSVEYSLVQAHPQVGYDILKDIAFPWPVADIAHQHHERMDGSGYPQGLKGEKICLEARIVAVADVVEAISSHRPYRPQLGLNAALDEITTGRNRLYDTPAVDACLELFASNRFSLDNN